MIAPLIMFDLDGTLAESKQPLALDMASALTKLLAATKVAVISGGALPQFLAQVVERLPEDADLANLYLLPTSGAALYEWNGAAWSKIYEEKIAEGDAKAIAEAMEEAASATGLVDLAAPSYGPRVEYRGGQVSFSALGQKAPITLKKEWDPKHEKRRALQAAIAERLPAGFSAGMGGATTIDVTRTGVDKSYGIHRLSERLHIPETEMLYVGDELTPSGNDDPVFKTNAQTRSVASPAETLRVIVTLLAD